MIVYLVGVEVRGSDVDIEQIVATGEAQATVFVASASVPDGVFASFLSPVSAVRINSTALAGGSLVLRVNQGEGA
jgi:hypothetical protein